MSPSTVDASESSNKQQTMFSGRTAIHVLNTLMLLLFVTAAVVQYNDPDPVLWMVIYGGAAACCALYMIGRLPAGLAALLSAAYALGALYLLARIFGPSAFFDETGREMMGLMEESREMLGLWIIAAWVGFLAWRVRRDRAPARHAT